MGRSAGQCAARRLEISLKRLRLSAWDFIMVSSDMTFVAFALCVPANCVLKFAEGNGAGAALFTPRFFAFRSYSFSVDEQTVADEQTVGRG